VHDVFLRSWSALDGIGDAEMYAYLRRAVVNAWKNHRRHHRVEARWRAMNSSAVRADASTVIVERETLWAAIARLPDRQRAVIVLQYYEDLADADIARLLDCAEVTVRTQTRRALFKLRAVVVR
jgi:RNA polymerase sigma factor (sigma-70 family)